MMNSRRHAPQRWAVVVAVTGALVLSGCVGTDTPAITRSAAPDLRMSIGALLPQTGALAAFGPAAQAGVDLAVQDINDADLGLTVTSESRNSADATSDIALTSVAELIALNPSAIVGAISDGVSKKVIDQIVQAGIVEISPGNTSLDFSRYADDHLYWRTSPSCAREGAALGQQIADSGVQTLGIVYQSGYCQPGLPEAVADAFERAGGKVLARAAFDATATDLSGSVAEVVAEKPGAVAVITPTAAKLVVPGLTAAGYLGDRLYFVGLGISDHSADFATGSLTGATATLPGLNITTVSDFTDRLLGVNPALTDFSYAAESYDAVMVVALAALAAGDTSGVAIAGKLQEVSGGTGDGIKARDFAAAARIILSGKVVDYDGPSGAITFDENGDPAGAIIGLYSYGANNTFTRIN